MSHDCQQATWRSAGSASDLQNYGTCELWHFADVNYAALIVPRTSQSVRMSFCPYRLKTRVVFSFFSISYSYFLVFFPAGFMLLLVIVISLVLVIVFVTVTPLFTPQCTSA